ncbi:MAG: GAF domain-containing sensor histidine kinase [Acidimicrobiales bacterium]
MPYRSIDDPSKLRRVLEATLLIERDLELPALLRHVAEEAQSMTGARYAALGVLNEERTGLAEFVTVGLTADDEKRIGPRPTGRGMLGLLISHPEPLRMADLGAHGESLGFPPNHPPMTSFLGVPIKVRDEVYGNLYLTDKIGWSEFTHDDQALVQVLALAAGIAIENARLHQQVRVVAVYEDRDRVARDLHDTVIQRLFGVGLKLQSMAGRVPGELAEELGATVAEVDRVIERIRTTIYQLGMGAEDRGVRDNVLTLVRELSAITGFDAQVSFDGPVDTAVPDDVAEHLLATIRESVTNIGRHAHATSASVSLTVRDGECSLLVVDNGDGLDESKVRQGGLGLANMRHRAEKLGGSLVVEGRNGAGTSLTWTVPLAP